MKRKILVTAGPVWASLDKVRVITNIFGGNLGWLIAKKAAESGLDTTLLFGPGRVCFPKRLPHKLKLLRFKFFDEFYNLLKKELKSGKYNVVIHAAAVPDYMPYKTYHGKIKSLQKKLVIKLKPTIKIVDQIKKWDKNVFLVKFKLEVNLNSEELIKRARKSMAQSKADLIVANDFKKITDKNHYAFVISPDNEIITCKTKKEIASYLLAIIKKL